MQPVLKNQNLENVNKLEKQKEDGKFLAKYFKYIRQFHNPNIVKIMPLEKVAYLSFYREYKRILDGIAVVFDKHGLDVKKYIEFFICDQNMTERQAKELVNIMYINMFIETLKKNMHKKQIYEWFMKSVENISDDCISGGFSNTKQYLQFLIKKGQLAAQYMSGRISAYYLAAIPKFDKIIQKFDSLSRDEFQTLKERYDIYNTEINESFLFIKNIKPNPIKMVDDRISEKIVDIQTRICSE